MKEIGLNSVTFRQLSVEEIINLVKKVNIKHIEWGTDIHVPNSKRAKEVYALCEKEGILCSSLGSYYRLGTYGKDYEKPFREYLDIAKELKARTIRIWAYNQSSLDVNRDSDFYLEIVNELKDIADIAEKEDISVSFEHHQKTLTDHAHRAIQLIEDSGSKNVFMYWQVQVPLTFEENRKALRLFKPYLKRLHICHQTPTGYLALKDLKEDFSKYFAELDDVDMSLDKDHDFVYLIEFVQDAKVEAFIEDIEVLKDLLDIK